MMRKVLLIPVTLMVMCFVWFAAAAHAHAAPATFTVTNTNDSGAGSLRQAIIDANSNTNPSDMDRIEFNITGSGVHTIAPVSALPNSTEKVTVDGYSQPGASVNTAPNPQPLNGTVKIEIDFSAINSGTAWEILGEGTVITGISYFSTSTTQKLIAMNGQNTKFIGNYAGVRADGLTWVSVPEGTFGYILLNYDINISDGCQLGGTDPAERNIISGINGTVGTGTVSIYASNCVIQGNYFGLAKDGVTDIAGGYDVGITTAAGGPVVAGIGNVIGGDTDAERNILSGFSGNQLIIAGDDCVIQGNYIGTDYTGAANVSIYSGPGVIFVATAANNVFGGLSTGERNILTNLQGLAIGLNQINIEEYSLEMTPSKNALLGNSISNVGILNYPSFGNSNLGIDFMSQTDTSIPADNYPEIFQFQGPTPNDTGDVDTGPNSFINHPVLKTAQQVGNQLTITYDLDAADSPTDDYRVEFFANDKSTIFGYGPGQDFLGAVTASPGTNKTATLTVNGDLYQKALSSTTTAIDAGTSSGFGSTSEFSQNIGIGNSVDLEADGVLDSVELSFPPLTGPGGSGVTGDGNNDGIPDNEQPNVSTRLIAGIGDGTTDPIFTTFEANGCSSTARVQDDASTALPVTDTGYNYPFGVVSFTLNCSRGVSANIIKYYYTDRSVEGLKLRKYIPSSQTFIDVPATITSEVVGGRNAIKLMYSLTDGGQYDDDGEANGIIVDPVGLAIAAGTNPGTGTTGTTGLADTGDSMWRYVVIVMSLLAASMGITGFLKQNRR